MILNHHYRLGSSELPVQILGVGNWALGGGFYGLTDPVMWWYNGSTYCLGYESNIYNNKVWAVKQTGDSVEAFSVNNGTSSPEPENHPTPLLYINEATGYIYVIQNQFHVSKFEVWKSTNIEDISSFSSIGTFDLDGAYLTMNKFSGTNLTFTTRGGASPNGYDQRILEVDLDTPSGYTDLLLCEGDYATNNTRFYPTEVHRYGTSSYYVGGAQLRNDTSLVVCMLGVWITTDFDTYENIAQTYSKDIPATSQLTWAEFTTNLLIVGSTGDTTTNYGAGGLIQIDNDIFSLYLTATNTITLYKFTIGTSGSVASLELPYSISSPDYVYTYYDGTDIIIHLGTTDGDINVGRIDTGLSAFTYKKSLNLPDGLYVGFPWNFNDIPDATKYMIGSRSVVGGPGSMKYIITDNKWL